MNFDYNEEQQLLADSVRRFLAKDYGFEARKKIVASKEGWSAPVWATMAEMGLTGLPFSTEHGGFGGGAVDLMGVMEAAGDALHLGVVLCAPGRIRDPLAHLRPSFVVGRIDRDVADGADGFRDGPPHVLAVRHALAGEHLRTARARRVLGGFAGQAALAHASVASEQHQVSSLPRQRRVDHALEQRHLRVAPDQRCTRPTTTIARPCHGFSSDPCFDRLAPALHCDRTERLVADGVLRGGVRRPTNDHTSGISRFLQSAGSVHHVTHRRVVAARAERAHEHLTGVDADAELQVKVVLLAERFEGLLHLECAAHGALSVVFMCDRGAEQRDFVVVVLYVLVTAAIVYRASRHQRDTGDHGPHRGHQCALDPVSARRPAAVSQQLVHGDVPANHTRRPSLSTARRTIRRTLRALFRGRGCVPRAAAATIGGQAALSAATGLAAFAR